MKTLRICGFVLVLVLGIVLLSGSVTIAQDSDPEAIYRAAYDAFNAGDVDGGMALIADDVVGVVLPKLEGEDTAQIGKEAFQSIMEDLVSINAQWAFDDFQVKGNTVTYRVVFEADGFFPLELHGFSSVSDGLIESEVWSLSDASRAEMDAATERVAVEELVTGWLHLWDTVNGDMDDFDRIVAEDFVSHNAPSGDREVMRSGIEGFRADNPGAYFPVEDLVFVDGKAYLTNSMWMVPEDAEEGDEGEPATPPFLLVLSLEDGQITERWVYAPLE